MAMHLHCVCCSCRGLSISASREFLPLGFLHFKPLAAPGLPPPVPLTTCIRSRHSSKDQQLHYVPPLSDRDNQFELQSGGEEDEDDEDDDEFEFDEYEDDEIAADEYTINADASDSSEEEHEHEHEHQVQGSEGEEQKAERVKNLLAQVREFGPDLIDYQELAAIYDFPIDRFQVPFCSFFKLHEIPPYNFIYLLFQYNIHFNHSFWFWCRG
jgi:hypothetical protein